MSDVTAAIKHLMMENCIDDAGLRGRRVHPVWEHFNVLDNNSMECVRCGRTFKTTGSTTVCKHHLRSRHPEIFAELAVDEVKDWRTKTTANAANPDMGNEIEEVRRAWHDFIRTCDFFDNERALIVSGVQERPIIWRSDALASTDAHVIEAAEAAEFAALADHLNSKLDAQNSHHQYTAKEVQTCWYTLRDAYKCWRYAKDSDDDNASDAVIAERVQKFVAAMSFLDAVLPAVVVEAGGARTIRPIATRQRRHKRKLSANDTADVNNNNNSNSNGNSNNDGGSGIGIGTTLPPVVDFDYFRNAFVPSSFGVKLEPTTATSMTVRNVGSGEVTADLVQLLNNASGMNPKSHAQYSLIKSHHISGGDAVGVNRQQKSRSAQQHQRFDASPPAATATVADAIVPSPTPASSLRLLEMASRGSSTPKADDCMDESSPLGALVVDLHRKLRERNNLQKAVEFKRTIFNLISEYELLLL